MSATFCRRVRIGISLIERFGIKRVLIAARESHRTQGTPSANVFPISPFRRYQGFK